MSETIKPNACPKCHAPIPPEAPQGLCPKCVLGGAANPTDAGGGTTATGEIPTIPRIGVAFPQLEILELIGRGGMGFVFKARQPHLDRYVALKLLPDKLASDPQFAERFNREGRFLAKLNHPNIVSIFDFGQAGGFYFLLMEYVDGVNLRQAMQAGRFSPAEALAIVPRICEALQYAHEQGVLHRDIKPENILLDAKGRVKIADFGIAKLVGEDAQAFHLTGTGAALGTPHYMAPEQFEKPSQVDHRADIYSLGVVFYEMLTGELPIGRFKPPSERTPLDQRVDEIVMRALEKERELRQKNAGEFKTQVEQVTSHPESPGEPGKTSRAISPAAPAWSLKAIWGAVLIAISLVPIAALLAVIAYFAASRGVPLISLLLASAILSLPGIAGTILGWMALNDIRIERLRGLPLAVFAALTLPLLLLVGGTLVIPFFITFRTSASSMPSHFGQLLMLLVPAGVITFAIWSVYTAARWGSNQPPSPRRGVLKWIFLALVLFGIGVLITSRLGPARQTQLVTNASPSAPIDTTAAGVLLKGRVKVAPTKAITSGTTSARAGAAPSRKIELSIPTITDDPYKNISVTTDSELPAGDYLVGLLQRPDGRVDEQTAVTSISAEPGGTRSMKHLLWTMSSFETNRVREIIANMRSSLDGRVVELKPRERWRVFQATNEQGAITEGFIALRSDALNATNVPSVTVSIVEVPKYFGPFFMSVKLRVSAPPGYLPHGVGLLGDGSLLETRTSIGWSGDFCSWYFPREFGAQDSQELGRQLEATKASFPNGIKILPGQRAPMFSVTNQAGTIFHGFFELPAMSETK
jgi:tRNA A-37 threonylcarbamoyl transferase component Bud32